MGGLRGLEYIIPGIGNEFLFSALDWLSSRFKDGDAIPNVYAQIPDDYKLQFVRGSDKAGGPIDYMYIGSLNVKHTFDNGNLIFTNGELIHVTDFAATNDLFLRLRARRRDQRFDSISVSAENIPRIYSRSKMRPEHGGRVAIVDRSKLPAACHIIPFV